MTTNEYGIIFGTDFHNISKRTPTLTTLKGLHASFPFDSSMEFYKLFFIGGDWTDRLGNLSEKDSYISIEAATYILRVCAKYGIKLRIIEGTRSHDRGQSMMFEELNRINDIGCDIRYFKELAIEHIEDLDLTVLYLPDEWHHDSSETLRQVKEMLAQRGLKRVDYAIVHGGFKFQFPIEMPSLHDEVAWSELVNYLVLSGHIHRSARMLKILCGGSFNRNNHDEDEVKGHWRLTMRDRKLVRVEFKPNPYAKIYTTLNVFGLEIQDILSLILELGHLPKGSAIRLEYQEGDPIKAIREVVDEVFHNYIFTDVKRGDKKQKEMKRLFSNEVFKPVEISRTSICKLIAERLSKKGESDDVVRAAQETIEDLKSEI